MASLVEVTVSVRLRVDREDGPLRVIAQVESHAADGTPIRKLTRNITPQLSAARATGVNALLDDVIAWAKGQWEIP